MKISTSHLRQNIYKLLDQVLRTGKPLDIERKGQRLRILPIEAPRKLAALEKRSLMRGSPEDFVHIDWSSEWKPEV